MTEPILYDNMEKASIESNLSITSNDINIKLSKDFLWNYERTYITERIMKTWWITLLSISCNNEWKESKYENPPNAATDSFFKAYDVRDIEKENRQGQMKRKDNDKDDKRPHKKICKTEKFEAIKYSLGPNEEYLAIRRCEYDIWERNEDSISQIYQEIF
ncbi:hypothetical protein Tco_1016173 [Tanacetum coccineum]|uniref:Uncharacterized protein n=1 Tax=Tanacetum coccineum TaxID=301880 RepID=A0ABQ5FMW5_9ASTR